MNRIILDKTENNLKELDSSLRWNDGGELSWVSEQLRLVLT